MMEAAAIVLLLLVLFAFGRNRDGGASSQVAMLTRRVRHLEQRLDAMATQLGVTLPPEPAELSPSDEVRRLVREGRPIQAIKRHREETGLGLAEAKDVIDELREHPDDPGPRPPRTDA